MIYIVRHGQTDWNKNGKIQGRTDIELNQTGIEQAMQIKEKLKDVKFDKAFSSPLKRAFKTAQVIFDGEIVLDNRLLERGSGELEGKRKDEVEVFPDFNNPNETRFGIENAKSIQGRVKEFFDEILKKYKNKNVLVVTHAGVCIYSRCYFEGEPENNDYDKYKLKNCEFLTYEN